MQQAKENKIGKKIHLNFFSWKLNFWLRAVWSSLPKEHKENSEQNTKHKISHRKLNQLFKIPLLLHRQHSQHKTSPQHHCWGLPWHKHREVLWGTDMEVCWRTARAQSVTEELKYSGLEFSLQKNPIGRRMFSKQIIFNYLSGIVTAHSSLFGANNQNQNCIRFWLQEGYTE